MKESKFTEEQIIAILRQAATGEQTIGAVRSRALNRGEHFLQVATEVRWPGGFGSQTLAGT
jgi:hypothetical protein